MGWREQRSQASPQVEPCFSAIPGELCNKSCTAKLFSPLHPGLTSLWLWGLWGVCWDRRESQRTVTLPAMWKTGRGSVSCEQPILRAAGDGDQPGKRDSNLLFATVTHSLPLASHILTIRLYNRDPKLQCLQEEA